MSRREVVGAAVGGSELICEIIPGVKAAGGIKTFLILRVATLHLAVMAGRIRTEELMAGTHLNGGCLKEVGHIPSAAGKTVCEFKAVVHLDALHPNPSTGIPFKQSFQEISRGISGLLRVGSQETQPGELVNSCVLE